MKKSERKEEVQFWKLDNTTPRTRYVPNDNVIKIVARFEENTGNINLFLMQILAYLHDFVKERKQVYDEITLNIEDNKVTVKCYYEGKCLNEIVGSRP